MPSGPDAWSVSFGVSETSLAAWWGELRGHDIAGKPSKTIEMSTLTVIDFQVEKSVWQNCSGVVVLSLNSSADVTPVHAILELSIRVLDLNSIPRFPGLRMKIFQRSKPWLVCSIKFVLPQPNASAFDTRVCRLY